MGIDPAGNTLDGAMPRYQLSLADAADLVAYIKSIGEGVDAGVTETAVRLGVILPPASVARSTNRMMRQVLLSYFARVNAAGGLFNRRVDVAFCDLPPDRTERAAAVREFLTRENIFAVACGDFTGAEGEIARALLETRTPGIAAFAAF